MAGKQRRAVGTEVKPAATATRCSLPPVADGRAYYVGDGSKCAYLAAPASLVGETEFGGFVARTSVSDSARLRPRLQAVRMVYKGQEKSSCT